MKIKMPARLPVVSFVYAAAVILTGTFVQQVETRQVQDGIRLSVDENILRQLQARENKGANINYEGLVRITNIGKRTLMVNKENLSKFTLHKRMTTDQNNQKQFEKRQIIAPGYYQAECSEKKPCKDGKYCNLLYCEDCHKDKMACTRKGQCCKELSCTFGRCEKKAKGDPGTFCEKDTDCKTDSCCVLEPTVNTLLPICKPKLAEYHQCASILYRKIWIGEKPDCGPCQQGLECAQKGILSSHQVCMKPSR